MIDSPSKNRVHSQHRCSFRTRNSKTQGEYTDLLLQPRNRKVRRETTINTLPCARVHTLVMWGAAGGGADRLP